MDCGIFVQVILAFYGVLSVIVHLETDGKTI